MNIEGIDSKSKPKISQDLYRKAQNFKSKVFL